jgi:hypothetical protein
MEYVLEKDTQPAASGASAFNKCLRFDARINVSALLHVRARISELAQPHLMIAGH